MNTKRKIFGVITIGLLLLLGCQKEIPASPINNIENNNESRSWDDKFPTVHISSEEIRNLPNPSISFGGIEHDNIKAFSDLEYTMPPLDKDGQGHLGSCTSWAVGYAAASYYLNKNQLTWNMSNIVSPSYIYSLTRLPQGGSYIDEAMALIVHKGAIFLSDKPYSERECGIKPTDQHFEKARNFRLNAWTPIVKREIPNQRYTETDSKIIKAHLSENHPVVIGVLLNNASNRVHNDIYEASEYNRIWSNNPYIDNVGHAMTIVGHNDRNRTYKIMNSWGEKHFITATYEAVHNGLHYAAVFSHPTPEGKKIEPNPEPTPNLDRFIGINRNQIDFGRIPASNSTHRSVVTITNNGDNGINLDLSISGTFRVSSNRIYLAGNSRENIQVIFSTNTPGTYTSELVISSSGETFKKTIPVRGICYEDQPKNQELIISGNLNFGRVEVGSKETRSFDIKNPTSEYVEIYDISTPDGFNIIGNTQFSIGPNARKSVQVEFDPDRARRYSGTIEIGSNLNKVARIQVSGQGEVYRKPEPHPNPQPRYEDFQTVPRIGSFTNPVFDDINGNCGLYFHSRGNIISSIIRIDNEQVTLRVKKTQGAFIGSGRVYIKKGYNDPCSGSILAERSFYPGDNYVDLTFNVRSMRRGETIYLTPTLNANGPEIQRYYGQSLSITRR